MSIAKVQSTRTLALLAILLLLPRCGPGTPAELSPAFAKTTNLGIAHLENRNSAKAAEAFEKATELAPKSALAQRNLARAYLLDRPSEKLHQTLARARELEPEAATTHYLTGLAFSHDSRFEEAIGHFEEAARLDPHTTALRFQLASAYQAAGRHEGAVEQLRETVRLDPLHTAAHYRLVGYVRREGDREELERRQRELLRLRNLVGEQDRSPDALERCIHTQAEPALRAAPQAAASSIAVRFQNASHELAIAGAAASAAVLEVDESGRYTLLLVEPKGQLSLLRLGEDGRFVRTPVNIEVPRSIMESGPVVTIVGDFHNTVPEGVRYDPSLHARNDVLILSPGGALLLEQELSGGFDDVTTRAGLSDLTGNTARWVDYEHDGDVDLAVARQSGTELWQNSGDGRFKNVTTAAGIRDDGAVVDLSAADLDGDEAIDLVLARGDRPTQLFENQRVGQFAARPDPPGPWPPARHLLLEYLDGDEWPDAVLVDDTKVLTLPGGGGKRQHLELGDLEPRAATLIDYDNDGRLDLCVAGTRLGGGALRLWRNLGDGNWWDATSATELASAELSAVHDTLAADFDNDGDSDLLLVTETGLELVRNEGGQRNGQLKVRLQGTKTNPTGIGTRVQVRAGNFSTARLLHALPIELGLGDHRQLDSVQTVWTNGVVDNQIEASASDGALTIVEQNVAAGSCPFLYAWDGRSFRFVTDLLGNSPVGLSLRRGEVLAADPDEFVLVGDSSELVPRGSAYVLELTEELREVLYLDHARLVAVDHDFGTEVHPTDRLMPPPFPPSELWALRERRSLRSALGDDGIDRTASVLEIDGVFAPPGTGLPPPLRGKTQELILSLDFGPLKELQRPVMALTGWLQYGDASTNIAMSQNPSLVVVPPTLEMELQNGQWLPVDVVVGMPAGKTKTIVIDLTNKLEEGVERLRLRTTFEIRWDRIALFERLPNSALEVRELLPTQAELRREDREFRLRFRSMTG
ncbi:MAG: tetratricopeptide repeat protein [bacterium]|nr:tetratricopeptide repeat protein [bacterium]